MILYYALGGGLGHLARARRVIARLDLTEDIMVLGVAGSIGCLGLPAHVRYRHLPARLARDGAGCRAYIRDMIGRYAPQSVYIDCFPAGILGELAGIDFGVARRCLIARALRWKAYRGLLGDPAPRFDAAYVVEPLEAAQHDYLARHCAKVQALDLSPSRVPGSPKPEVLPDLDDRPLWLVAHSGPGHEVVELMDYALAMMRIEGVAARLLVIALERPPHPEDFHYLGAQPASAFFPHVARIVTACGFNTLLETRPYRERHYFLPFARRYDDQFARAARYRADNDPGLVFPPPPPIMKND